MFLLSSLTTFAQEPQKLYEPDKTRVLFLLDGSGSMKETWEGRTKFEIARDLLEKSVDSITREGGNVEFALRVFGHQSPREMKNCEDSKLEVGFSSNSIGIKNALARITPQGHTPIAYSLFLSAQDFPRDPRSVNAIVLITDGLENCEGDPCASSAALRNKRIALKPFIIGLGLKEDEKDKFDCVGTYFDAAEEKEFKQALQTVVSQALGNTTVQINLLDQGGKPSITDVELSLYDSHSGELRYNLIHAILKSGAPDTVYLDPSGKYDITVHTTPPKHKRNIELTPGKHNIVAIDAPLGTLSLAAHNQTGFNSTLCVVRTMDGEVAYVQNLNSSHDYLAGDYLLEMLTLPRSVQKFTIRPAQDNIVTVAQPGQVTITAVNNGLMGIYTLKKGELVKVVEIEQYKGEQDFMLQPGTYTILFRPNSANSMDETREETIRIESGKFIPVRFGI